METAAENGLRTHRPSLDEYVFCNPIVAQEMRGWIEGIKNGTASRTLLLTGPSGHGKTSLALASAKALGASPRDITENNCANLRTLEDARSLLTLLNFSPVGGTYRVLILDEVHQMMGTAIQAFLTPLEKLSKNTIVIACTTDPGKLAPAFRNRFYEIKLGSYTTEQIVDILSGLPGLKISPKTIALIAGSAGGNPRAAIGMAEKGLTETQAETINQENLATERFLNALYAQDKKTLWLATKLLSQDKMTDFYNRIVISLDAAYQIRLGLNTIHKIPQLELSPLKTEEIAKILSDFLKLQKSNDITDLKVWVLTLA
jgi:DNA polymerase III gamma/tau subunit